MEKSQTELLQHFQEEIEALKQQIAALESKITACQAGEWSADDEAVDFTDIEIGVEEPSAPAEEPAAAPRPEVAETEVPFVEEPEPILAPEPAPAPEPATEPAPAAPKAPAEEDNTLRLPWRTDKPGMPVKNIRSGISLLDRALFIGTLFKEDFALYDQTIADLNAMESLDEAVDYIREHFPAWNLKSDVVYHFMMSVRKKLG